MDRISPKFGNRYGSEKKKWNIKNSLWHFKDFLATKNACNPFSSLSFLLCFAPHVRCKNVLDVELPRVMKKAGEEAKITCQCTKLASKQGKRKQDWTTFNPAVVSRFLSLYSENSTHTTSIYSKHIYFGFLK